MKIVWALAIVLLLPAIGVSATIYVPDNYPTIQAAIDAAANGDTVIVRAGTYVENIDFTGKAVTVRSEMGPELTTIDGNQAASVATFVSGETAASVLEGFTLTNGKGKGIWPNLSGGGVTCQSASSPTITGNIIKENNSGDGGGILCISDSSPTISKNMITNNTAKSFRNGGGIYLRSRANPVIVNNVISNNTTGDTGGGIFCLDASPVIINNVITGNEAGNICGGIYCEGTSTAPLIYSNTLSRNNAKAACGGIYCLNSASPTIINCIVWGDTSPNNTEIQKDSSSSPFVNYSDVKGGWAGTGNIDADPLFVDPDHDDFHIAFVSPCKEAGDNSIVTEPYDFEGDPRIVQGTVDMGADEFNTHLYHIGDVAGGGLIKVVVLGGPGFPVLLAMGSGIQDPPKPTPYGDLWIKLPPAMTWNLGQIPSTGVRSMTATVPPAWPSGSQHFFQALVGPLGGGATELTNLMVLTVE